MKIVINTTNLVMGGALQVALSFLEEAKSFREDKFYVFLSAQMSTQIDVGTFPDNFFFYHFDRSPATLRNRRSVVSCLQLLESEIRPDVVFSVFGPSYWTPQAPHVMGVADGWCYNPESVAWTKLGLLRRIKVAALVKYKMNFYKKNADFYVVETSIVKDRIVKLWEIPSKSVFVVQNTHSSLYDSLSVVSFRLPDIRPGAFKLVTISADYVHKNIDIIQQVVPHLKKLGINCVFVLTIPEDIFRKKYSGLDDWVVNLGPVPVRDCPSIYRQCDALFHPTLLESFTASYPEAMKMDLPILTSDLDFAHAICLDAAEYFDPLNPEDIARKIEGIINNVELRGTLVRNGTKRLVDFPSAKQRAKMYIDICKSVT